MRAGGFFCTVKQAGGSTGIPQQLIQGRNQSFP
jgi:hypothetical protein